VHYDHATLINNVQSRVATYSGQNISSIARKVGGMIIIDLPGGDTYYQIDRRSFRERIRKF
jgi:hypothetical protein